MNIKLLEQIFHIPSRSKHEQQMAGFIRSQLDKYNITYYVDKAGNIFNTDREDLPMLSCHMDTVQDECDALLAKFIRLRGIWLTGYGVIGGDDKCGVFLTLEFACAGLCNFVFSVEEETGAAGIKYFTKNTDLSKIPYALILDRRGSEDIICTKNSYGTDKFENVLLEIGKVFNYKQGTGTFSDANYISDHISCANLSVGYYNPHTKQEFVNLVDLKRAMNFTHAILKNVHDYFPAPKKTVTVSTYTGTHYDWEADYEDYGNRYNYCSFCGIMKKDLVYSKIAKDFICKECWSAFRDEILDPDNEANKVLEEDKKKAVEKANQLFDNTDKEAVEAADSAMNAEFVQEVVEELQDLEEEEESDTKLDDTDEHIDALIKQYEAEKDIPIGFEEEFSPDHHSAPSEEFKPQAEELCFDD